LVDARLACEGSGFKDFRSSDIAVALLNIYF